jgi:hypothetical protein
MCKAKTANPSKGCRFRFLVDLGVGAAWGGRHICNVKFRRDRYSQPPHYGIRK